jgi:FkbM family methyltransferase
MKLTKDKKVWIPDGDNWWWRDGYERKQFLNAMKYVSNRKTALDIGAHVGIWSKRLAELFNVVIAFEPVPEHVECWNENVKKYNASLQEVALSNKAGKVNMKVTGHNSGMSTLEYYAKRIRTSKEISVETKTLDSYHLGIVDFMKIDVEGHEMKMLEGAMTTIQRHSPIIFIEIHKKEKTKSINAYAFLIGLGYQEVANLGSSNYLFSK